MTISIRFDANQQYQRDAIDSVVELFAGQDGLEQGIATADLADAGALEGLTELIFGNSLDLAPEALADNLLRVQNRTVTLPDGAEGPSIPDDLRRPLPEGEAPLDFSVEMETGTGKTYVYLRTIVELHLKYGFRKFVIVVPSVAIREGVLSSLDLLRDHIRDTYDGLQYDHHVYDSKALNRVRQFATSAHLQILVVNIAAMAGDAERLIMHRPTDAMNGFAPIEFLSACRPVVILDEPQSLDGKTHRPAIEALQPLFRVGYSATPPEGAHTVYRLTPVDAYAQRLVKQIAVYSIEKDRDVNEAFVEVTKITATAGSVTATATIYKATAQGTKPTRVTLRKDDDLFEMSGGRDVYAGWVVEDIHADREYVEFANGQRVSLGESSSASDEQHQRLMLRHAVERHFAKEFQLQDQHRRGVIPARIKPLTLFFVDKVADYAPADSRLRSWFVEEYEAVASEGRFAGLNMPDVSVVHDGYFAQTSKGVAKDARADSKDAADAFSRIMRNKQALLGFEEPLRFIFSHSALAEGWDNPNVFTICNLQDGKSKMRKRQQVGRGLRLPVMEDGDRCHVDDVNLLTVIAKDSFANFAEALQKEIEEETGASFTGRIVNARKERSLTLRDGVLASPEFVDLWSSISPRTRYRLDFDTDAVVSDALRRIAAMPKVEPVKYRISNQTIVAGSDGLRGDGGVDRGDVIVERERRVPDVVGELTRRLPISRATIVRILRDCGRLDEVEANAALFIDQVADAIDEALFEQMAAGIVYEPTGEEWSAEWFVDRHQSSTFASRVVDVERSVTDRIVCDSDVEVAFAEFLDSRDDVPLFVKLPGWFKVPTPLGNYNPDWAFVREMDGDRTVHLVRETKGGSRIENLRWESEGWKIRFGRAHFDAIDVDYEFGNVPEWLIEPKDARLEVVAGEIIDASARFTTHLPVYSLEAVAGYFDTGRAVEDLGWLAVDGPLEDSMFVARVVGRSMEPTIPDGSWGVFRRIGAGSRQGKIVLAELREAGDPETGGAYTVKRYESEVADVDGERVGSIRLVPANPDFTAIVVAADAEVSIVAEFVRTVNS